MSWWVTLGLHGQMKVIHSQLRHVTAADSRSIVRRLQVSLLCCFLELYLLTASCRLSFIYDRVDAICPTYPSNTAYLILAKRICES